MRIKFFISITPATWCNGLYVVFGEVVDGFDVVETINSRETLHGGVPVDKIVIAQCGTLSD